MRTSETNPADWFMLADDRLKVADASYEGAGATYTGVELLQEAAERYLKGYLIGRGWDLKRTHDLSELVREAMRQDARFADFEDLAEDLTDQFWAQHYPGGDLTDVGGNYADLRAGIQHLAIPVRSDPEQAGGPIGSVTG
jgi:HEPN domain-containing protein